MAPLLHPAQPPVGWSIAGRQQQLNQGGPKVAAPPRSAAGGRSQRSRRHHAAQANMLSSNRSRAGCALANSAAPRSGLSGAFGERVAAPIVAPRPYIHAAMARRGNTVIISAVLAGVEGATAEDAAVRAAQSLDPELRPDGKLVQGQLENGLRYVILPNKIPPKRFEAHMEVHVGSVDELPNEQGIAHLVEHVTFLGSARRESLLGTGARANAYTDFHHTVFHVHSPVANSSTGAPMLPQVLEALLEIAFQPAFLPMRIEKERKAVTAEAQMMNTIEYRVDCQLLQYLHYENNLGCRFPIGKMDQVAGWTSSQLKEFWGRWYFPANATLYVVGDLDRDVESVRALITRLFGNVPAAATTPEEVRRLSELSAAAGDNHQPPAYVALPPPAAPSASGNGNGAAAAAAAPGALSAPPASPATSAELAATLLKQRHPVRPPVTHTWGYGPLEPNFRRADVGTFRHPLLQHYTLSVFCKLPIVPMTRMEQLRQMFLMRILLSTFQFRVNKRYVTGDPPFLGITLDISDSGREGCAVCTLTVTSEPAHWRGATAVAVQEMRRLQRHGLTQGELDRYKAAILRDSAQLAEQGERIPSVDTLNFVMESLACGHTVMDHRSAHEAMVAACDGVTLEAANALARSMLTFASDYGREAEALAAADASPALYTYLGPTRTTSILVCIPAYVTDTGDAVTVGGVSGARAAANLGAAGHIDVDQVDLKAIEEQSRAAAAVEDMVPEGAVRFELSASEIQDVLADTSYEVEAPADVACPVHLIPPEEVDAKLAVTVPHFVALDTPAPAGPPDSPFPPPDPHSGIVQRKLSNGMTLNYRRTDNEPLGALLRVIAPGGKAAEKLEVGTDGFGAVLMGPSTLNETGTVGSWRREEVEVFCITNMVNVITDCDEENVLLDMHFSVAEGSMEAAFELLHMFLEAPAWSEEALARAKAIFRNNRAAMAKSLEKETAEKVLQVMMGGPGERRFRDPTDEELDALTLQGVADTFRRLMHPGAIEINIVGDIDGPTVEALVLRYLGSIAPRPEDEVAPVPHVTQPLVASLDFATRHSAWHLQDSDERAAAVIGGAAPARWGPFDNFDPLPPLPAVIAPPPPAVASYPNQAARQLATAARRAHPLYSSCLLMVLTEVINSRLFTTVRDSLGLTYDVSFQVTMMDRVRAGWFTVTVTSDPGKIYDALDASAAVLRDLERSPISRRELARARMTILTRHESDLKDNMYWLGLLTHLQNQAVPWKTAAGLRDLRAVYESITVDDMYDAVSHFKLDDDSLFSCVGTSGRAPVEPPEERLVNGIGSSRALGGSEEADEDWAARGGADGAPGMNPLAMFTAMLAAAQSMNLKRALDGQAPRGAETGAAGGGNGSPASIAPAPPHPASSAGIQQPRAGPAAGGSGGGSA